MWRLSTADTFNLDFLKVLNSKKYSTLKIVHCIERVGTIGIILGNHLTGFYPSDKKKVDLYFMLPCAIGDVSIQYYNTTTFSYFNFQFFNFNGLNTVDSQ